MANITSQNSQTKLQPGTITFGQTHHASDIPNGEQAISDLDENTITDKKIYHGFFFILQCIELKEVWKARSHSWLKFYRTSD